MVFRQASDGVDGILQALPRPNEAEGAHHHPVFEPQLGLRLGIDGQVGGTVTNEPDLANGDAVALAQDGDGRTAHHHHPLGPVGQFLQDAEFLTGRIRKHSVKGGDQGPFQCTGQAEDVLARLPPEDPIFVLNADHIAGLIGQLRCFNVGLRFVFGNLPEYLVWVGVGMTVPHGKHPDRQGLPRRLLQTLDQVAGEAGDPALPWGIGTDKTDRLRHTVGSFREIPLWRGASWSETTLPERPDPAPRRCDLQPSTDVETVPESDEPPHLWEDVGGRISRLERRWVRLYPRGSLYQMVPRETNGPPCPGFHPDEVHRYAVYPSSAIRPTRRRNSWARARSQTRMASSVSTMTRSFTPRAAISFPLECTMEPPTSSSTTFPRVRLPAASVGKTLASAGQLPRSSQAKLQGKTRMRRARSITP